MSIKMVMPSNHFILCCPLLRLPSIFPSIRVFSNELALCIRQPKYWSFSISPSIECSGLISFRIHWLNFLAVQGTLKRLFQHHSSKASILQHSAFFIVQLSHPYMTTGRQRQEIHKKSLEIFVVLENGEVLKTVGVCNKIEELDKGITSDQRWNNVKQQKSK